jgi:hypothetical protein
MMDAPTIGTAFRWGSLGVCKVEQLRDGVLKFRAGDGVLYQVSVDYWRRMADGSASDAGN